MTIDTISVELPAGVWLAKLPGRCDPVPLLEPSAGLPRDWASTPLATSRRFGGVLSAADVGAGVEPNLDPIAAHPMPGDRILLAHTGARVQILGVVVVTSVRFDGGGVAIGHEPLIQLTRPVDLREVRRHHHGLDARWDRLFGRSGRDRRLLPLHAGDLDLVFSAFGISLEALFDTEPRAGHAVRLDPRPAWATAEDTGERVSSELSSARVAAAIAVYYAVAAASFDHPSARFVEVTRPEASAGSLVGAVGDDRVDQVIAASLELGQRFSLGDEAAQMLLSEGVKVSLAVETETEWLIVLLGADEALGLLGEPGSALFQRGLA